MSNPEVIEIEGLKTIHKLCKFGADNHMEGSSFTKIVERMFEELSKAKPVSEWISVNSKEPPLGTMVLISWSDAPDVEPEKDFMDHDVDHGVNYWVNYNDGNEPSHWMLLPKPVAQEQTNANVL